MMPPPWKHATRRSPSKATLSATHCLATPPTCRVRRKKQHHAQHCQKPLKAFCRVISPICQMENPLQGVLNSSGKTSALSKLHPMWPRARPAPHSADASGSHLHDKSLRHTLLLLLLLLQAQRGGSGWDSPGGLECDLCLTYAFFPLGNEEQAPARSCAPSSWIQNLPGLPTQQLCRCRG